MIKLLYILLALACLHPLVSAPLALIAGFIFAALLGKPFEQESSKAVSCLLKAAVVGLGFGMNMQQTLQTSQDAFVLTVLSISFTLLMGFALARLLGIEAKTGHLVSSGTAICGGSAIAAVSQVIKADARQISISIGVVFLLNSVALLLFPTIGHAFDLSQTQFGTWCAIAIHDTSSVVGAALAYGEEALTIATTVKLARVLWIIPIALLSSFLFKSESRKLSIPWFIALFIGAILINTYLDFPQQWSEWIGTASKRIMVLTLFLVGSGLSIQSVRESGLKPIGLGLILWLTVSVLSLGYIFNFHSA